MAAINKLADKGMFFWDYGNAFLLEAQRAGELILEFLGGIKMILHAPAQLYILEG